MLKIDFKIALVKLKLDVTLRTGDPTSDPFYSNIAQVNNSQSFSFMKESLYSHKGRKSCTVA